ncbi:MAG: DedA family protein [Oleibacter sp.]|nr:DedA family protein [Thalassolituus sp.]
MLDTLLLFSDNPAWLVLIVIVSTFMLEDLAIIGAALLASSGKMAPETAFLAVCIGMVIGDTALYFFGRLALVWPWLSKKLEHPLIQRQIVPLQQSPWHQLMLIRCMPGLRTFGYIACGVAKVPLLPFSIANLISIIIWAAGLFYATYFLGQQYGDTIHKWMWVALPIALVLFFYGQYRVRQRMEESSETNSIN